MRHLIDIISPPLIENHVDIIETIDTLLHKKDEILPNLERLMDSRSISAIFETDYDTDDEELASQWFDACISTYRIAAKQPKGLTIYRHMMVENVKEYISSLQAGVGKVGEYWSLSYGIESPTWKQDQSGDNPIVLVGTIALSQINWSATLSQNFEWPHEWEVIFTGGVFVDFIEDQDTDKRTKIEKHLSR